jgi:hypothetical protein
VENALFEAMLEGWARQHRSRMLREGNDPLGGGVGAACVHRAEAWPWEWGAEDLEEIFSDLASVPYERRPAPCATTSRSYPASRRSSSTSATRGAGV